jgi:magnesium-transporting ATPase (P-type)
MSVIVRKPNNEILLVCKGADSVIMERLYPGQDLLKQTNSYLDSFAKTGLRTLLIASKKISEQDYREWSRKYAEALTSTQGKEK